MDQQRSSGGGEVGERTLVLLPELRSPTTATRRRSAIFLRGSHHTTQSGSWNDPGRRPAPERKATSVAAFSRAVAGPRVVGEPVHVWSLQAREPGDPVVTRLADHRAGRSGKAKAVRLR